MPLALSGYLNNAMTVLDISVPTGFIPLEKTLDEVIDSDPRIMRYDVAGRKVIFYSQDMAPGEEVEFEFKALACYPVRAKGVTSKACSYYKPEWEGETLSQAVVIVQ